MKLREILLSVVFILLFLFSPACGKKGPLRMPETIAPQAIKDLRVKAEGNAIIVRFSIPSKNTDGSPLTDLQGFKILRSIRKLSEGCENCPRKFIPLIDIGYQSPAGQVPLQGVKREFRDTNVTRATEYQYKVISYNSHDEYSRDSNSAKAFWDLPPSPIEELTAIGGSGTVTLSWKTADTLVDGSPSQELISYNCYITEEGKDFPFAPVNDQPVDVPSYQASDMKNDQAYTCRVHAVRKIGDGWVESEGSSLVIVTPADLEPPSTPQALTAFWTDEGISLRWELSPEPDVLGYTIYRKEAGETTLKRLNPEPLKTTIFLDPDVKRDKEYYYAISAVDSSSRRNESPLSEEVKVTYFP